MRSEDEREYNKTLGVSYLIIQKRVGPLPTNNPNGMHLRARLSNTAFRELGGKLGK